MSVVALREADEAVYAAAERVLVLRRKVAVRVPEVMEAQRALVAAMIESRRAFTVLAVALQVDPAAIKVTAEVDDIVPPIIDAHSFEDAEGLHVGRLTMQFGKGVSRA